MKPPRFLVTAGNTREKIDDVRDWGNIFTGNTGFAIARALAAHGPVDLLTSNRAHAAQAAAGLSTLHPITAATFTTCDDLVAQIQSRVTTATHRAVFMTAAVADYRPVRTYAVVERRHVDGGEAWIVRDVQAGKVKSTHRQIAVLGEPTPKIIDMFRTTWGYRGLLVKFKLEVGLVASELLKIGEASRAASGADYLVANTLDMVTGDSAGAYLISATEHEHVSRADLPRRLAAIAAEHAGS